MVNNSPTSINVYNQCPRLYYYQFISKRKAKASLSDIVKLKGTLIHKVLEDFFLEKLPSDETNYEEWCKRRIKLIFIRSWDGVNQEAKPLGLDDRELRFHHDDCWEMLSHWIYYFIKRIYDSGLRFEEAFRKFTPKTEIPYFIKEYLIKGVIDVIEDIDGEISIIDYKTSSKFNVTREYKLQLAIYAYAYEKTHGIRPKYVGILFLREGLHRIAVDDSMIEYAERECKKVFEKTQSIDIKDYPQNFGYECKSRGSMCECYKYEKEEEEVILPDGK